MSATVITYSHVDETQVSTHQEKPEPGSVTEVRVTGPDSNLVYTIFDETPHTRWNNAEEAAAGRSADWELQKEQALKKRRPAVCEHCGSHRQGQERAAAAALHTPNATKALCPSEYSKSG